MLSERTIKLPDMQGYQKQSFIGYEPERKLRKKFVIEYCNDVKKLEELGKIKPWGVVEVDDIYHRITLEETETDKFDSFDGIAMAYYISYYMRADILDVKMWEQLYDGSEMIQERYIQPPSTLASTLENIIAKEVKARAKKLEREVKYLEEENKRMQDFIEKYNAMDMYRKERTA